MQTLVIPAKAGIPLRRFRKKNRADIAGGRLRIPAFAGMTKCYSVVIVFTMPLLWRSDCHDRRRPISSHTLSRERGGKGGFLQFHHASLYSAGEFGSVVKCAGPRSCGKRNRLCKGLNLWSGERNEQGNSLEVRLDSNEYRRRRAAGEHRSPQKPGARSRRGEFADIFWWGVGENKGPAVWKHLADCEPEVLFSRGLSGPAKRDTDPDERFFYTAWHAHDPRRDRYGGEWLPVPENVIVVSGPRDKYFALVCRSQRPLNLSEGGVLDPSSMRNLNNNGKGKGKAPGSSQTTCVVKYSQMPRGPYRVNLRADLVCPRFVKLGERKRLSGSQCRLLNELGNEGKTVDEYRDVVRKIRG